MDLPKDIIYETETVPRPPNMFTCPNCNITITMRGRGSHIKSKNHKIKVETETVPRPPNMFTCPQCNITITMRGRGSHNKSKNHKIKELDQNTETTTQS
jgi:transcription initiation factor IIE alpha subunit